MFRKLISLKPRVTERAPFAFAELRAGGSRVVIVPSLGGKIVEMDLAGRQWLWTNDVIPRTLPSDGMSYAETADTGGYDECLPTVGPCAVPTWVRGFGGLALPDHGELWAQTPEIEIRTSGDGQSAVTTWTGRRMPYHFVREVRVTPDGDVSMRYELTNTGSDRLPFIWSSHPLLPLTSRTRVQLPHGSRVHVYSQHQISIGERTTEMRWPFAKVAGKMADLSRPESVAKRYACKLFVELGVGRAAIDEGDFRLEVAFDSGEVPNLGLWINKRGWSPFKRDVRYMNIALEPCVGAPDTLEEALGAWNAAQWVDAGATRHWSLVWRGRQVSRNESAGSEELTEPANA